MSAHLWGKIVTKIELIFHILFIIPWRICSHFALKHFTAHDTHAEKCKSVRIATGAAARHRSYLLLSTRVLSSMQSVRRFEMVLFWHNNAIINRLWRGFRAAHTHVPQFKYGKKIQFYLSCVPKSALLIISVYRQFSLFPLYFITSYSLENLPIFDIHRIVFVNLRFRWI